MQSHGASGKGDGDQDSDGVLWQVPAQSGPRPTSVVPPNQTSAANSTIQTTSGGELHSHNGTACCGHVKPKVHRQYEPVSVQDALRALL